MQRCKTCKKGLGNCKCPCRTCADAQTLDQEGQCTCCGSCGKRPCECPCRNCGQSVCQCCQVCDLSPESCECPCTRCLEDKEDCECCTSCQSLKEDCQDPAEHQRSPAASTESSPSVTNHQEPPAVKMTTNLVEPPDMGVLKDPTQINFYVQML